MVGQVSVALLETDVSKTKLLLRRPLTSWQCWMTCAIAETRFGIADWLHWEMPYTKGLRENEIWRRVFFFGAQRSWQLYSFFQHVRIGSLMQIWNTVQYEVFIIPVVNSVIPTSNLTARNVFHIFNADTTEVKPRVIQLVLKFNHLIPRVKAWVARFGR